MRFIDKILTFFDGKVRCEHCSDTYNLRQVGDPSKPSFMGYNLNLMVLCKLCLEKRNTEWYQNVHKADQRN